MKIYDERCNELRDNGGILKKSHDTRYYKPGYIYHREDGPAIEWWDGDKCWYYNNKCIMRTEGDVTQEQLIDFKLKIL